MSAVAAPGLRRFEHALLFRDGHNAVDARNIDRLESAIGPLYLELVDLCRSAEAEVHPLIIL